MTHESCRSTVQRLGFHVGVLSSALLLCTQTALAQIAPGVTQSAAHTATISGTIVTSSGAPVAGANIELTGTAVRFTKSAANGAFSFESVPWGTYEIIATSSLGTASQADIALNGDVNVAIRYQAPNTLHTIAHVSTSSAGAHINVTSSSVVSLAPSDYTFGGNGTWKNLFAQTPGVAVSGLTSGGYGFYGGVQGPQNPAILVMNGALPNEISTSLDGMPLFDTSQALSFGETGSGFDLSNLPLNAFETADVVRGPGANAPSIVDSIGGSFVLHGPGPVSADRFDYSASNDPYGGIVTNSLVAFHLGNLSATLIYGVNDSPGPLTGTTISAYSHTAATVNGQPVWDNWVNYYTPNPSGVPNCNCAITDSMLICCVPDSTAWSEHSGAVDLSYRFTRSVTAEVFYVGDTSDQLSSGPMWPVEFSPGVASPPYSGNLAPSPPGKTSYLLIGAPNAPEPQTQSGSLLEEKVTAYVGKGVVRFSAVQFNSWGADQYNCNAANGTYRLWGTASVGPTYPGTPTAFNGVNASVTFPDESLSIPFATHNRDLLASYALQLGASSSAGISYVTSYFNAPNSYVFYFGGTPVYSESTPPSVAASTNEIRLHFDTQIGDTLSVGLSEYVARGTYHVPASAAGTYKDLNFPYSAPRLGIVWRPNIDTAIRASVGGGYALPSLYNVTGSPLTCGAGFCTETLANPALKPEEAFGFDIGADLRVHRDTVLSVDAYLTNLFGQFFNTTGEATFLGQPLYQTTFGNIGTSRMEGVNLDARNDVPSGIYWRATLGLTRGYVISVPAGFYDGTSGYPPTPCARCTNQTVIPGANFNSAAFLGTVPYAGASAQLGYRWDPQKYFDLTGTYYGNNNIYYYPAFIEVDAHAGYQITKALSLLVTFQNITGIHDQPLAIHAPTSAVPVIAGASGFYQGVTFGLPYAPRAVIGTLRVSV